MGMAGAPAAPDPIEAPDPAAYTPPQTTFAPMGFDAQMRDMAAMNAGPSAAMSRNYTFTEDEVMQLAQQQNAHPELVRRALENSGATITKSPPRLVAQPLVASQGAFENQVRGQLAEASPPAARTGSRGQGAPTAAPGAGQGGGGGGFRGLLKGELANRMAERDQTAQAYQDAAGKAETANAALVTAQQAGLGIEAQGLDQVAAAQDQTRQTVDAMRQNDLRKRAQEDEAAAQQQQIIDAGWKAYNDATIEDRRTPGERTMALAGIALSGLADAIMMSQGQRGQFQQQAIGLVHAQIERDADRQLEKLSRDRERLTQKERALQRFQAQVGDDRAFRDFLIQKQWEDVGHVADQITTRTQSEQKRNAALELKAAADAQAAQANADGMAKALTTAQDRVREAQDLGFNLSLKQALSAGQKPANQRSGYGLRVIDPNRPPTDAEVTKAQEIASGAAGIMDTIAQLEAMAERGSSLSPTERDIAARRVGQLSSQFNGVFGDGTAPNAEQLAMFQKFFKNPKEMSINDIKREYRALANDARSQTNAKMRFYNMTLDTVDVRAE